ncbi:MAG TPA: Xaa-Pro peptidase family protein [Bryobacteraceae bacterium]|nr:Xaa-Pro peptidase family protein [Bryobacteraceae bacterium]
MIDLTALKLDGFLVSHLPNVRYLTGFTGSNALVLITPNSTTLFTDPRYTIQAQTESTAKVVIAKGSLVQAASKFIQRKRLKNLGFEKSHLSYQTWEFLKPLKLTLKPIDAAIESRRTIKSPEEIARIRQAVQTNSAAFTVTLKRIRPGVTESAVAAELEYQMRRRGAEKPAFETIVAFGTRAALPHAQPTHQKLNASDLVLIDMGATQNGYTSDMTRTFFIGNPTPKLRKMYEAVLKAQLAGIDAVREGVTADRVDRATRSVLRSEGLDKYFVHSTGHGLGLEIHEAPRLGRKDKTPLQAGMVITIEPGVYMENIGGVRIEDTVLVTKNGCEVLTPTSKELMAV